MITVQALKANISAGKLHGTSLDRIDNLYPKMREAMSKFRSRVKPPTLIRRQRIENAIYDRVYNYTAPADITDGAIIDIRPVGERSNTEEYLSGAFMQDFDIQKIHDTALIEYINGTKTLRLSKQLTTRMVLHKMDSTTVGGTITLGGDASNATINTLDFVSGYGSLQFDLDGVTGQATITIALDNTQDLSDLRDVGALFHWLQFPDVSRLTSVELIWGSDATTNWSKAVTTAHDRTFASVGDSAWALLRHDWVSATENNSPTETTSENIDYIQIVLNYSTGSALSNVRMDNITASKGSAYEVVYYGAYGFTDSTQTTWKAEPTADSDYVMLDDDGIVIFTDELLLALHQELKGENVKLDYQLIINELNGKGEDYEGLYKRFKDNHPDQTIVRTVDYY